MTKFDIFFILRHFAFLNMLFSLCKTIVVFYKGIGYAI